MKIVSLSALFIPKASGMRDQSNFLFKPFEFLKADQTILAVEEDNKEFPLGSLRNTRVSTVAQN